jgi:DNA-binding CsgD family transcriptional regulator
VTLHFELLTENEKACLRLVNRGWSSRQIGAERGVRPDRIDKIIIKARSKLGDIPRQEAARLLVEHEAALERRTEEPVERAVAEALPTQSWGAPSLGLPDTPSPLTIDPVEPPGGRSDSGTESSAADRADRSLFLAIRQFLLGSDGSKRNDLDMFSSVAAITIVAAGSACVAVAIISLFIALDHLAISR